MSKKQTPSQLATIARVTTKQELNQTQRLSLVSLNNCKENRAVAAADVADVVLKTLRGHFQQKPEVAAAFVRAASGLEAPLFDPLFSGFTGHKSQLPDLFNAMLDPFAALSVARAIQVSRLGQIGLDADNIAKVLGSDAKLIKASTAKTAEKIRAKCAAFHAAYSAEFLTVPEAVADEVAA
jgi:hypothetical protein